MSQFLYYLPGLQAGHEHAIAEAGLLYALTKTDQFDLSWRGCKGPDGGSGQLVTCGPTGTQTDDPGTFGYFPDRQVWESCERGRFWLGFDSADPPGPGDLVKPRIIGGYRVKLDDDREWVMPLVRRADLSTELPQAMVLDPESGEVKYRPLPDYAAITVDAERVWQQLRHEDAEYVREQETLPNEVFTPQPGPLDDLADWFRIATRALALNYRVGPWEVSALKLISTSTVREAVGAIIDLPAINAMIAAAKKNGLVHADPGSSTDSGARDLPDQTTSPPGSTAGVTQMSCASSRPGEPDTPE